MRALIRGLPPESAFARHQLGPAAAWTNETELLASLVELTHANLRAKAGKKASNIKPLQIPRPGDATKRKSPASPEQLAAFLQRTRGTS